MSTRMEREIQMERLFEAYYSSLYLYALHFLEDEDEAKDVVSDTFAAIWQQWQQEDTPKDPSLSYLYASVKNRCVDLLRHTQAKENYAKFIEFASQHEDDAEQYEERIRTMNKLIEQLPEPGKTILQCCYFRKMTYQETADFLHLTLVVVRKNMLKMFKLLREGLTKENEVV